jgi:exosortase family protein XrtF
VKKLLQNKLYRFILFAVLLYLAWLIVYEYWLHPLGILDRAMIDNIIWISAGVLKFMGYELIGEFPFDEGIRTIGIDGTHGVWVGDPCNGISLFALFTGFVLAFPGPIKHKLWFIPLGLLLIHAVNLIRVIALVLIVYYAPEYLEFNHTYTFTLLVYGFVFFLWWWWANKLSRK